MASKYGKKVYGDNYYSRAWMDFTAADLIFAVLPAGSLANSTLLVGNVSFGIGGVDALARSMPVTGDISVSPVFFGSLYEYTGIRADLTFTIDLHGELFRAAEREFRGILPFSVDLQGRLGLVQDFVGSIDFPVTIGGGVEIYIGPFWIPDVPVNAPWVPDAPSSGFWIPDTPIQAGWQKIPQERPWGS